MDYWFIWLQAKIGPISYGAFLGFVLQVILFRPSTIWLALERAVAAVAVPMLFARPIIPIVQKQFGTDPESTAVVIAGVAALGGVELVHKLRKRILKTASTGVDSDE